MQEFEDCFFVAFDETPIHYRVRQSDGERAASVLIIHGAGEYPARYDDFASFLAHHGIASYAIGLRGHGRSGGARAYVGHFQDFSKDCLALAAKIRADSPRPLILLGHSMGGLVAACAAADPKSDADGLVLSSPFFGLGMKLPAYIHLLASVTARLHPRYARRSSVPSELLTHDPEKVQQHRTDPEITRIVTSRLFDEMTRAACRFAEIGRAIHCPVFVAQAGDDRIVCADASRRFYESLTARDKEFKLYEGLFHEILNEMPRRTVYDDILHWIQKRTNKST